MSNAQELTKKYQTLKAESERINNNIVRLTTQKETAEAALSEATTELLTLTKSSNVEEAVQKADMIKEKLEELLSEAEKILGE